MKMLSFKFLLPSCVCVSGSVGVPMPHHSRGGQRTTLRNQFCPSILWVPGIQLGSFSLRCKCLYLQGQLSSLTKIFSSQQALDETAGERVPTIPDFQAHSEFQKACAILQRLRDFLPTSPTSAQVNRASGAGQGVTAAGREGTTWRLCPLHHERA